MLAAWLGLDELATVSSMLGRDWTSRTLRMLMAFGCVLPWVTTGSVCGSCGGTQQPSLFCGSLISEHFAPI